MRWENSPSRYHQNGCIHLGVEAQRATAGVLRPLLRLWLLLALLLLLLALLLLALLLLWLLHLRLLVAIAGRAMLGLRAWWLGCLAACLLTEDFHTLLQQQQTLVQVTKKPGTAAGR